MRLWSFHPKYLDAKGIVALWREGLLANAVLKGNTKGYVSHPQLVRFRAATDPIKSINAYLWNILIESQARGYSFDSSKIVRNIESPKISVTRKQLEYEFAWLKMKLLQRDCAAYERIKTIETIDTNPFFYIIDGEIESWEKINRDISP